ncbi:HNH endonuclease [Sphingobium bisphenolivorans]|uniref:HNH endonuclease n=1 Tax=Sphingobium bisphenolivorans TaxID=1335760 RepID=UPI0004856A2B|nr:HNH endonuclease [Sphingobium bisphenolivorans]
MSDGPACWLCGRTLGRRIEWHHPVPKSRGGRDTVPVHPICHRTIHANLGNAELARVQGDVAALRAHPAVARFLGWIAGKPPDFHAPTHRKR